jgi:hypothetical protein
MKVDLRGRILTVCLGGLDELPAGLNENEKQDGN